MSKIIIENNSTASDQIALEVVSRVRVIEMNRIWEGHYCHKSTYTHGGQKYAVETYLNKCSDRFVVRDVKD